MVAAEISDVPHFGDAVILDRYDHGRLLDGSNGTNSRAMALKFAFLSEVTELWELEWGDVGFEAADKQYLVWLGETQGVDVSFEIVQLAYNFFPIYWD